MLMCIFLFLQSMFHTNTLCTAVALHIVCTVYISSVQTVDLFSCNLKDAGITMIAEALKKNTNIAKLSAIYNDIGDDGAKALAATLKVNTALIDIRLQKNLIGDEGVAAIAEALRGCVKPARASLLYLLLYLLLSIIIIIFLVLFLGARGVWLVCWNQRLMLVIMLT